MMYWLWDSIMQSVIDTIDAKRIVEIGMYEGTLTSKILAYAESHDIEVQGVDPDVKPQILELKNRYNDRFSIIEDMSLNAVPRLNAPDVIIIDGDHNWYTVFNELKLIALQANVWGSFPLILLHDTGWPFARRDMYHNPATIPDVHRQPHGEGGLLLEQGMLGSSQEGLVPGVAKSIYENAMRNGVLSAVEDFLADHTDLRFVKVEGFHGLGILAPQSLLSRYPLLQKKLDELSVGPSVLHHLEQLEHNRVDLQIQLFNEQRALRKANAAIRDEYRMHEAERARLSELLASERMQTRRVQADAAERHQKEFEEQRQKMGMMHESHERERKAEQWLHAKEISSLKEEHASALSALKDEHTREIDAERAKADVLRETLASEKKAYEEKFQHCLEEVEARFTAENTSLKERIVYVERSRSWRWTAPLRKAHLRPPAIGMNRIAYGLFGSMRRIWTKMGMPFPRAARFVRHRMFGRIWPARQETASQKTIRTVGVTAAETQLPEVHPNTPAPVYRRTETSGDIAVIIPCHNYGRFLGEAIESVLRQTLRPEDILVVDDASDDDTRDVAMRYADRGVRYVRGEWRSVGMARNTGLSETSAPYLVFLDADNMLHPDYLRCCLDALKSNPDAAIAYGDQQYCGDKNDFFEFPDSFNWTLFDRQNHMDSISMVRRDALIQASGWSHGIGHDGDWITWRRILALGWQAAKSDGVYFYRIHGNNMIFDLQQTKTYAERGGFFEEPATLFLSLSGRSWAWPMTREFLEGQTFPHHLLHIVVTDTSGDESFGAMVKTWLQSCDYRAFTYLSDPVFTPGLADLPRDEHTVEVSHACARIYNTFAQHCQTTLALFLEDDIEPPLDVFPRLIRHFDADVLSIGAAYYSRIYKLPVGWKMPGVDYESAGDHPEGGVSDVFGSGFGCTVMRGSYLRQAVFRSPQGLSFDYDFFSRAHEPLKLRYPNSDREFEHPNGWRTLVDWDCICRHYSNSHTWV